MRLTPPSIEPADGAVLLEALVALLIAASALSATFTLARSAIQRSRRAETIRQTFLLLEQHVQISAQQPAGESLMFTAPYGTTTCEPLSETTECMFLATQMAVSKKWKITIN